jgi:hypothetical protein
MAAGVTGVVGAVAVTARWDTATGLGFAAGLGWGVANFWALAFLLRAATGTVSRGRVPGLIGLKLALYGLGGAALLLRWFPPPALIAGFTWLLVVLVLRAAGAMWLAGSQPKAHHEQ